jgi:hypothetical protein
MSNLLGNLFPWGKNQIDVLDAEAMQYISIYWNHIRVKESAQHAVHSFVVDAMNGRVFNGRILANNKVLCKDIIKYLQLLEDFRPKENPDVNY